MERGGDADEIDRGRVRYLLHAMTNGSRRVKVDGKNIYLWDLSEGGIGSKEVLREEFFKAVSWSKGEIGGEFDE
jgi:hypothetical protein